MGGTCLIDDDLREEIRRNEEWEMIDAKGMDEYIKQKEERMNNWVPQSVVEITKLVKGYVVGGAVRDHLLNKPVYDYDISTPYIPGQVESILRAQGFKTILTGAKYGTVSVLLNDLKRPVEITTYRQEFYSTEKGRFPDVAYHLNRDNDLMRRDFTINAMAYDAINNEFIDPHGGMHDIMDRKIKFVGNGFERIKEDPLRIIRACRIAATLGFRIEDNTSEALTEMRSSLTTLSQDRMVMEIRKANNYLFKFIQHLLRHHLTEYVFGFDFTGMLMIEHDNRGNHYGESIWKHTLDALERADKNEWFNFPLRMAILYHDAGKILTKSEVNGKIQFLNHETVSANIFTNSLGSFTGLETKVKKQIEFLIQNHMMFPLLESKRKIIRTGIDWKIQNVPFEWIENLSRLAYCDRGIEFNGLLEKLREVYFNVPRPDGTTFLKYSVNIRKDLIRQAWIENAHQSLRW